MQNGFERHVTLTKYDSMIPVEMNKLMVASNGCH